MATAQLHQQMEVAPEQAENQRTQPGPEVLQEEEKGEPGVQMQERHASAPHESEPASELQESTQPSESGQIEKRVDVQEPGAERQGPKASEEQSTRTKEQEVEAADPVAPKSPESAQLRARRLAVEAAEAREVAEQAAKLAAEKQSEALAAAKEAFDELRSEQAAAKTIILDDTEEVAERASKQQKLSTDSSQNTFRQLLQTTAEESLRQAVELKATAPRQPSQSSHAADAPDGDALQSAAQQFAVEATESVQQMMEATVGKTLAEMSSLKHAQEGSKDEQPKNPAEDAEVLSGQPGLQMTTQAPAIVPIQPPTIVNGIQGQDVDPNFAQNVFANTTVLLANDGHDSFQNSTAVQGKSADGETYRTTPENQPTEQGPAPMQVG